VVDGERRNGHTLYRRAAMFSRPGSAPSGPWDCPASFAIRISPPWWNTCGSRLACIIVAIALVSCSTNSAFGNRERVKLEWKKGYLSERESHRICTTRASGLLSVSMQMSVVNTICRILIP